MQHILIPRLLIANIEKTFKIATFKMEKKEIHLKITTI